MPQQPVRIRNTLHAHQAATCLQLEHFTEAVAACCHKVTFLQVASPSCSLLSPWTSPDPHSYMRQLCAPGYYGPLCSLCVASGPQAYGRVGALQCKPCRTTAGIVGAYVASALVVLAWLSYTVHVTLVENEEAAAGRSDSQRTSQLIRVSDLVNSGCRLPAVSHLHWRRC